MHTQTRIYIHIYWRLTIEKFTIKSLPSSQRKFHWYQIIFESTLISYNIINDIIIIIISLFKSMTLPQNIKECKKKLQQMLFFTKYYKVFWQLFLNSSRPANNCCFWAYFTWAIFRNILNPSLSFCCCIFCYLIVIVFEVQWPTCHLMACNITECVSLLL